MNMVLPVLLAFLRQDGCRAIPSESVFARDMARAIPEFSQFPPDFLLGYVNSSGAPRVFHAAELERLAKNRGIEAAGLHDVCFARQTFVPSEMQIREAMRKTLVAMPGKIDARIEVVESSRRVAPTGELIFPRNGIQLPSAGQSDVMWHGFVQYGENGKFPVWARVRITASTTRIVAISDIQNGKVIQPSQVRLETCEDSPLDETTARNLDEVVGFLTKNSLRAGSAIHKTQVERPPDVARGDLITVDVYEGAAHLAIDGIAESAGSKGTKILVKNPASGKDFRAQVTGKGAAAIGEIPAQIPAGGPLQ